MIRYEGRMHKYAGVSLDWLDDGGELLRRMCPTPESLPDVVKQAEFRPRDQIPESSFALCLRDSGHELRKFACLDAGTTVASLLYFLHNSDKLESTAQKVAASNLAARCLEFDLDVPAGVRKFLGREKYASNQVVVSKSPETRVISNESEKLGYALPSESRYPITGWADVDKAVRYWGEHRAAMPLEDQREFAVNVVKIAAFLGHPVPDEMLKFAAQDWAPSETVDLAMEARKLAADRMGLPLDDYAVVYRQKEALGPEKYAEALVMLDRGNGMSRLWDKELPNPYRSTFGIAKTAETIWSEGADRLTSEQLANLVTEHSGELYALFSDTLVNGLERDPFGIFNSLPLPQKRIIARLAAEKTHNGKTGVSGVNSDVEYPEPSTKDKQAALRKFAGMAGRGSGSSLTEIVGILRRHKEVQRNR